MIRIWNISGEELAAVSVDSVKDVIALKYALKKQHGFPLCLQQLLHNGSGLDNASKLDAPIDVQLVLLPVSTETQSAAASELTVACRDGFVKAARLLVEAGAMTGARSAAGKADLIYAAKSGHKEIVQLLLEAGADKDLPDRFGNTALINAARNGYTDIARLLLEAGANKYIQGEYSSTALIFAARNGHAEVARLLLESCTSEDLQGQLASEALRSAAGIGHEEIVKLLSDAGAVKESACEATSNPWIEHDFINRSA